MTFKELRESIEAQIKKYEHVMSVDVKLLLDEFDIVSGQKDAGLRVREAQYNAMNTIMKENQRLREALGFYAEKSNWCSRTGRVGTSQIDILDRDDPGPDSDYPYARGKRAREALKNESSR